MRSRTVEPLASDYLLRLYAPSVPEGFDERQLEQIRQIVKEERGTNWAARVLLWIGIVILVFMVLTYLASQTLMDSTG